MKAEDKTIEQRIEELKEIGIISAIDDGISILGTDYKILYQNQSNKDFIGDHVGEYCYKVYERREQVCKDCVLAATFNDGKIHTIERSTTTENGIKYFEIMASPLKDSTGKIIAGIEVARNITERKQAAEALHESEKKYRALFEQAADSIVLIDVETGTLVEFNNKACENLGYTREEFQKLKIPDFEVIEPAEAVAEHIKKIVKQGADIFETKHREKGGQIRDILISSLAISIGGRDFIQSIWKDITEQKKVDEALRKVHDELELHVKKRTSELSKTNKELLTEINKRKKIEEELCEAEKKLRIHADEVEESNTALRVLLKQRENDKQEFEDNILSNIKHLILPYIAKLKKMRSMSKELSYLNILESNLNEIISPFSVKLSSKYLGFTPKEIQIANLIKDGKHNKDIMEILNISFDTVKTHRQNIRKKLGILKKSINLRVYLLSLK